MTIDAATVAQAVAQLGATGLLAVGLWVVWRRLLVREDRIDHVVDEAMARQERVIKMLTNGNEAPPAERRDRGGPAA